LTYVKFKCKHYLPDKAENDTLYKGILRKHLIPFSWHYIAFKFGSSVAAAYWVSLALQGTLNSTDREESLSTQGRNQGYFYPANKISSEISSTQLWQLH